MRRLTGPGIVLVLLVWLLLAFPSSAQSPAFPPIYSAGFESGDLEDWVECYTLDGGHYLPVGDNKVVISETEYHSGAYGIRIAHDSSNESLYQGRLVGPLVRVNPGSTYIFSAWAKSVQASAYPSGSFFDLQVVWWNELRTDAVGTAVAAADSTFPWSHLSNTLIAPDNAPLIADAKWAHLAIDFYVNPGYPLEVYFDDLSIEASAPHTFSFPVIAR